MMAEARGSPGVIFVCTDGSSGWILLGWTGMFKRYAVDSYKRVPMENTILFYKSGYGNRSCSNISDIIRHIGRCDETCIIPLPFIIVGVTEHSWHHRARFCEAEKEN